MSVHVFVDESKRDGYLLCAAVVAGDDLADARRLMRDLKPGNRRRLHMHDEGPASRRKIVAEFVRRNPGIEAHLWRAPLRGQPERMVRDECLAAMVPGVVLLGAERLVVESCGQDAQDTRSIAGALAACGSIGAVRFDIVAPSAEPLLWAADLVAWAHAAGGALRQAVAPFVTIHDA